MELPRGTFLYIKKGANLKSVLDELQVMKFCGVCILSKGSFQGSVVFRSGRCVLAEFRDSVGVPAWDELQKIGEDTVDLSVSALDDAQTDLALEFNRSCILDRGERSEESENPDKIIRPISIPGSVSGNGHGVLRPPYKNLQKLKVQEKVPPRPPVPPEGRSPAEPKHQPPAKIPSCGNSGITFSEPQNRPSPATETGDEGDPRSKSYDTEIDMIETMDMEKITSKIRGECKTLIKELHLDHMTER